MDQQELAYREQSASSLRLSVITGALDLSQFQVIKQAAFPWQPGLSLAARIIGSSHVLSFGEGENAVHEVCACGAVDASGVTFQQGLATLTEPLRLSLPGGNSMVDYKFTSVFTDLSAQAETILDWQRQVATGRRAGLYFNFPSNGGGLSHRTLILIDYSSGARLARTVHTYPRENRAVITTTAAAVAARNEDVANLA